MQKCLLTLPRGPIMASIPIDFSRKRPAMPAYLLPRPGWPVLAVGMLLLAAATPAAACEQCQQLATLCCPDASGMAAGDESNPDLVAEFGTTRTPWPQAKRGDPVYLTYSYENMFDGGLLDPAGNPVPASQIRTAIDEAFSVWSQVAPLHFTEVPDDGLAYGASSEYGTIRLRHRYINGPDTPGGTPTTKAIARYPGSYTTSGDIDFDDSDPWALIGTVHEPDLLGAAIHEIGHTLGLTHSNDSTACMYWTFKRFTGPGSGELTPDDIAAIQSVYGAGVGSVTPLATAVPEPTGWGLAVLALLLGYRTHRLAIRKFAI